MPTIAFVANTNRLKLLAVTSEVDGNFMNSAVVTATVLDSAGAPVAGVVWPVTLAYVAGSNGNYSAVLSDAVAIVDDQFYTAQISVDGGVDLKAQWSFKFRAKTRT